MEKEVLTLKEIVMKIVEFIGVPQLIMIFFILLMLFFCIKILVHIRNMYFQLNRQREEIESLRKTLDLRNQGKGIYN